VLKVALPYHESDHVLGIAYDVLCGGNCLQDIEQRRQDEVYLDALGAQRILDPTTAGDFCRRFAEADIETLQTAINVLPFRPRLAYRIDPLVRFLNVSVRSSHVSQTAGQGRAAGAPARRPWSQGISPRKNSIPRATHRSTFACPAAVGLRWPQDGHSRSATRCT
jgi:hypothetical protein